mmetsp:Transcript_29081/g.61877  ORF Transcript_29081/g.61877 Transcript_29081/m.61877 type:complete len:184 (+) Transcript_29081:59-610(+)|eukprot:CAMPEP_0172310024 /NCGR_PEP_ID=MMETSP1058-20130122/11154_1 /TAXON_ID=83371 /ORGANISM="Detonula confervacea, Strain CCMP 353" /LENGTH=183 /DNA_ID=CAMNT_0013022769 /DNA_START=45 /DNA_END=596 /DNA_ORIENTATION=+
MDNIAKGIPHTSLQVIASATPFSTKQGHSCCGGCCDTRRAVIILSIVSIIGKLIGLIFVDSAGRFMNGAANSFSFDDDSLNQAKDQATNNTSSAFNVVMLLQSIGILTAGVSIVGAFIFNKYLVSVNAAYLILTMFQAGLFSVVANGLYLYPHVLLILYIHNGIMSKENYVYERQSCCCVSPV